MCHLPRGPAFIFMFSCSLYWSGGYSVLRLSIINKMGIIRCRKKRKVAAALLGLMACVLIRRRRRRLEELAEEQRKRKRKRSVWVKDWIRKCCSLYDILGMRGFF